MTTSKPRSPRQTPWVVVALGLMLALGVLAALPLSNSVVAGNRLTISETTVEVIVHNCNDDFEGADYADFAANCTSEIGLYGIEFKTRYPDNSYTEDSTSPAGEGTALPMVDHQVGEGTIQISEVESSGIREPVVFCTQTRAGGGETVLDGEQVTATSSAVELNLSEGDLAVCDWYRFPGGILAGMVPTPTTVPPPSGTIISVTVWTCDPESMAYNPNDLPSQQIADLQSSCPVSVEYIPFSLDGEGTQHVRDWLNAVAWSYPPSGPHTISATLSGEFGQPLVFCNSAFPGEDATETTDTQLEVVNASVTYDLAADETLSCYWFNVRAEAPSGGGPTINRLKVTPEPEDFDGD